MGDPKKTSGLGFITDPRSLLESVFEHSPLALLVYRVDGSVLVANQAFRDLFGCEPLPGYNVLCDEILEAQGFRDLIYRAFLGETVHLPAHWYDPCDRPIDVDVGRRVGIEVTLFPLRGACGAVEHVAVCFKDVSGDLERLQMTEALRRSEQELAATLRSIRDAVIATDPQGRVTRMNPIAERLTGWTLDEVRGRDLFEVLHLVSEMTRQRIESPVERVVAEGRAFELAHDSVLVARDGTERAIADSAAPICDAKGAMLGVVLVFRDQTEERRAARVLHASGARKSAVLEAALDCIVAMDDKGFITEFNPAAERTFGYSHAEAVGKPLADLIIPPSLRAAHHVGLERYLTTGKGPVIGKRIELSGMRADGTEFPIELVVARMGVDEPPTFTGFIRDLTETKRIQQALQSTEERRRQLEREAVAVAARKNAEENERRLTREKWARAEAERAEAEAHEQARKLQVLAEASRAFAQASQAPDAILDHTARSSAELIGDACVVELLVEPTHEFDVAAFYSPDPEARELAAHSFVGKRVPRLGVGATVVESRAPVLVPVSEPREVHVVASPLQDYWERFPVYSAIAVPLAIGGDVVGVVSLARHSPNRPYAEGDLALLQDLADRAGLAMENVRLVRDLQAAIRVRDDFLAIAGHELRTPLTALLMQIQSLERAASRDPTKALGDRLGKAEKSAIRLERLINHLLDVSKISAGKLCLEPEPLDLADVVCEVIKRFAEVGARGNSSITLRGEGHVCGSWDRMRIEQVITNLLSNALKYGQDKPVEVELSVDGSDAVVRIIDHGIGIDQDQRERLFQRFERAVGVREFGGLGLGLWITKEIVEASGGRVDVVSTAGRGSVFTVRLPRGREAVEGDHAA